MNEKMVLFLLIVGIGNCVLAQTITIGGQATYYDTESESVQPLVNTRVSLETYDPVIVTDDVYTNENGFYSFSFTGSQPVQITTRLYFTNLQVAIESYDGPRNDYNTVLPDYPGDCDPPTLPCDYTIPGELMDFNQRIPRRLRRGLILVVLFKEIPVVKPQNWLNTSLLCCEDSQF